MGSANFTLIGYDVLGTNQHEGIRYAWKHSSAVSLVESAAFTQHSKSSDNSVCGYTASVSSGCILNAKNLACKFCRTGTQLPFGGLLTASEIAKQNVFMVLSDMYCSDHEVIRTNAREFAYMGQGEPGFSYRQVRDAIRLTNIAMKELGQQVFRHIVATSGVPHMIRAYIEDLREDFFSSRTTMHFSLHGTTSVNSDQSFTTTMKDIKVILSELDPVVYRLSFCEFNGYSDLGTFVPYDLSLSAEILAYARNLGFEAKLFSSFGKDEVTACGMLGGKHPDNVPSEKWLELEQLAEQIISSAISTII